MYNFNENLTTTLLYSTIIALIMLAISWVYLWRISIPSLLNTDAQSRNMAWLERFQANKRELITILIQQNHENVRARNRFRHHRGTNYPLGFRLDNRPDLLITLQYIVLQSGNPLFYVDNRGKVRSSNTRTLSFPSDLIPLVSSHP